MRPVFHQLQGCRRIRTIGAIEELIEGDDLARDEGNALRVGQSVSAARRKNNDTGIGTGKKDCVAGHLPGGPHTQLVLGVQANL